jgi:hypothetical protein
MAKSFRNANIRVTAENETERDGLAVYTLSGIENELKEWVESSGITYWLIEHTADDEVSTTHYHIVIKFRSPTPFERIKSRFPYGKIENTRNLKASIQYLIHLNDKSKVQYSWDDIKTNCMDMTPYKVLTTSQQAVTLENIYHAIEKGEIREYNKTDEIPISLFANNRTKIENALVWYREKIMATSDRNITVIFMSGPTGVGKTTFAKKYCEARGLAKCISSSSNDPMQDYKGQPVLILDDLRDDAFKYHDFLKLLDNHTLSTSKSRYQNKAFIGDTIIITSTKPIVDWYFNKSPEEKQELYRRVRNWFKFDGDRIYFFERDDNKKRYEPAGSVLNPIVMSIKKRKELVLNVCDAMGLEFTPSDKEKLESGLDTMTDDDWKKSLSAESSDKLPTLEEALEKRKQLT